MLGSSVRNRSRPVTTISKALLNLNRGMVYLVGWFLLEFLKDPLGL